jgi:hypothetical protein
VQLSPENGCQEYADVSDVKRYVEGM